MAADLPDLESILARFWPSILPVWNSDERQLIDALPHWAPVCLLPTIEKEENARGVIAYPEAHQNKKFSVGPLDTYVSSRHGTDHTIVTETPAIWSLEKRISVQRLWLRRALDLILVDKGRGISPE